jgi:uncharacterized metal-binding protein YceD (DUF177 family)
MNELVLELERLRDVPVTLRYDCPTSALALEDPEAPDIAFPGTVAGEVTFARVDRDVIAHGRLSVMARGACARCLEPTDATLTANLDELWIERSRPRQRRPASEDEDVEPDLAHSIEGDQIELAEVYREALLAELPDRFVCGADCKGLCPGCGANLNREPCRCESLPEPAKGQDAAEPAPDWKRRLKDLRLDA